jgi:dUTP pyrophosphatase
MQLQIKKLHPDAKLPAFAHTTDAGMDLFTLEDFTLVPGERKSVATGIAMAVPAGYVALIWDKSGVAHKRGIKSLGGVIDAGYTGEVFAGLLNTCSEAQEFKVGDKIAQLLIQKVEQPQIVEVAELKETTRGEGRFGSTGK